MKVMIKLDKDWEIEAEIPDSEIEKIKQNKGAKKNGYERVVDQKYYCVDIDNDVTWDEDKEDSLDRDLYNAANYYSDVSVAENNARADRLMRQLRRFAVEHREEKLNWNNDGQHKHLICLNYKEQALVVKENYWQRTFGVPYFDSKKTAEQAIETFYEELIWYFTEYQDSL